MTAPTDHEAALALLRDRFPESEGWRVGVRDADPGHEVWAYCGNLRPLNDISHESASRAARSLIASWDAATHAAQVRALVEAMRVLVNEAPANVLTSPENVCNYTEAQIGALRAGATALAALPASLRGKGGEHDPA